MLYDTNIMYILGCFQLYQNPLMATREGDSHLIWYKIGVLDGLNYRIYDITETSFSYFFFTATILILKRYFLCEY